MKYRPLKHITREALEPLWSRLDIPTARIADRLGVTRQAVSLKARTFGLPSRARNQICNQKVDNDTFTRMWTAGVAVSDIRSHFGYSHVSAVAHRRVLLGLPARTRDKNICGRKGNWRETISIVEYFEAEYGRKVREASPRR